MKKLIICIFLLSSALLHSAKEASPVPTNNQDIALLFPSKTIPSMNELVSSVIRSQEERDTIIARSLMEKSPLDADMVAITETFLCDIFGPDSFKNQSPEKQYLMKRVMFDHSLSKNTIIRWTKPMESLVELLSDNDGSPYIFPINNDCGYYITSPSNIKSCNYTLPAANPSKKRTLHFNFNPPLPCPQKTIRFFHLHSIPGIFFKKKTVCDSVADITFTKGVFHECLSRLHNTPKEELFQQHDKEEQEEKTVRIDLEKDPLIVALHYISHSPSRTHKIALEENEKEQSTEHILEQFVEQGVLTTFRHTKAKAENSITIKKISVVNHELDNTKPIKPNSNNLLIITNSNGNRGNYESADL